MVENLKTFEENNALVPMRGFSDAEFSARLDAAQSAMKQNGIDAVLLMTEPEVRYFTGFQTLFWQSPTRPWFLILPASGKPVAVIPQIGSALMETTWIEDIRTWSAPTPQDDGVSLLIEALGAIVPRRGTLGIMMGHESHLRMPLADFDRLRSELHDVVIKDAATLIQNLRMIKSPAEIEKIAHICGIASQSFESAGSLFHAGQPLIEAFRSFRVECLRRGADDVPYLVGGAGQGGYRDVISPPSARPLQSGDILMLDTGAVFDGYYCDFDRNFSFGPATDRTRQVYDTLYQATDAGLDAARSGSTCRDVLNAMAQVIGVSHSNVGRMGHGLGMQLTEQPSLASFDHTVLREGMVITLEPSLSYGDGQLMVQEENVVITSGAPRLLSHRAPDRIKVLQ